ncbi:MAG TPA: pathogenicity locus [Sphingobacteriaceae bacterium]|nr:pathogenicity locus [Sphingobacteriaceae bacterium]
MENIEKSLKELRRIPGVGKTVAIDLYDLGYRSIRDLKGRDAEEMYVRHNDFRGAVQDICMLYTFRCAVYFADTFGDIQDPEKLKWWYWMDEQKVDSVTKDKEIRKAKTCQ